MAVSPPSPDPLTRHLASERWLWGIVLLGFTLRLAALLLIAPSPPVDEEAIYSFQAIGWDRAIRPPADDQRAPGIFGVYRAMVMVFGPDRTILRWANVLFGTLALPLLYVWARRIAGRQVALMATFLSAIHPELVFYSASLWNEPLYMLIVYGALCLYLNLEQPVSALQSAILGVLLGLTALTREIGVFLLPVTLLGLATRKAFPRSLLTAAICLGAFFLTVLPWSIHISKRAGHPVLITEMNTRRFFIGNLELPLEAQKGNVLAARHAYGYKTYRELSNDPEERQALARRMMWNSIRDRLPWWPLEKVRQELPNFFTPNSLPAARLLGHPENKGWEARWAYRFSNSDLDRRKTGWTLGMLTVGFHTATILVGAAGLALLPFGRAAIPILVFGFVHLAPTLLTSACSRYRLPLTPLWILGASAVLVQGLHLWRSASWKRRLAAVLVLAGMAVILAQRIHSFLPPQYG